MKLFLSTDIEGTSGIVAWEQVVEGNAEYALGCKLLTNEVNAVITGAMEAGVTEFVVNDAHHTMRNLQPQQLAGRATLITGRQKPLHMMQGLDESFVGICLVSYHGSMGAERAVLSHTYSPGAVWEVRLNGNIVGESGINALVAAHYGVPIILISGDEATAQEAEMIAPYAEKVVVKQSLGRFAAANLHPTTACELLHQAAKKAIDNLANMQPPQFSLPAELEVTFLVADMAEIACWIHGVERISARSIRIQNEHLLELYRTFITVISLTRGVIPYRVV